MNNESYSIPKCSSVSFFVILYVAAVFFYRNMVYSTSHIKEEIKKKTIYKSAFSSSKSYKRYCCSLTMVCIVSNLVKISYASSEIFLQTYAKALMFV